MFVVKNMSFHPNKNLLLQQWVVELGSDCEVAAVCRTLIENGYGTGMLPHVAAVVPAVTDATVEGNADIKERREEETNGGGDMSDPLGVLAPHPITAITALEQHANVAAAVPVARARGVFSP